MFGTYRRRKNAANYGNAAEQYQAEQMLPGIFAAAQQQPGYGVMAPEYAQQGQPAGYGVLQQGMMTDTKATQAAAGAQDTDWAAMLGAMGAFAQQGGDQPMEPMPAAPMRAAPPRGEGLSYFRQSEPLRRRKRRGLLDE